MEIIDLRRRCRFQVRPKLAIGRFLRSRRALYALALFGLLLGAIALRLHSFQRPFGDKEVISLLLLGVDTPQAGSSRSDTIVLARIRLRPSRHLTLLSLPRDTRVRISSKPGYHKMNSAFALGGASLTRATIEENFGFSPDYTLTLNTAGMAEIVDALGGVEADVPCAMEYHDTVQNLHIHLKSGRQRLNGQQAVWYVRYRSDRHGDLGRVRRQQTFLKEMAKQTLTFNTLSHWDNIEPKMRKAFQTDLSTVQMLALANALRGLQQNEMVARTLPGRPEYIRGVSYYIPDKTQESRLFEHEAASLRTRKEP